MGDIRNGQGLNVLLRFVTQFFLNQVLDLIFFSIFVYLDDFNTAHNVIYVSETKLVHIEFFSLDSDIISWLLAFFMGGKLTQILIDQVDQPDLGLPLSMYLDLDSYADYIAAYKTYMVDTARVMVRELGTAIPDEQLAMVRTYFLQLFFRLFQFSFLNWPSFSFSDHRESNYHCIDCIIIKDSAQAADKIFDFEMNVALRMSPASDRRNSTAMYNPMTIAELKALMPNMDWDK